MPFVVSAVVSVQRNNAAWLFRHSVFTKASNKITPTTKLLAVVSLHVSFTMTCKDPATVLGSCVAPRVRGASVLYCPCVHRQVVNPFITGSYRPSLANGVERLAQSGRKREGVSGPAAETDLLVHTDTCCLIYCRV